MWKAAARYSRQTKRYGELPLARAASNRTFFFKRKPRGQLLGIEGLEGPRDFPRLAAKAVEAARQDLLAAERKSALELVEALDNASNRLCRIADAAEMCRNVHPDQAFVSNASDAVQTVAGFMGEVNLDLSLYQSLRRAEESEEFRELSFEAQTVLEHMRTSMEHEGIHLPEAEKASCLQLLEQEQQLSFDIVQRQEQLQNSLGKDSELHGAWAKLDVVGDILGAEVSGLPRRSLNGQDEVFLPTDTMWSDKVLKTSPCPDTRRLLHEAQQALDPDGDELMVSLLAVRQNLSSIRGYTSWAHYAQREALFKSPNHVNQFLGSVWERLKPGLASEIRILAQEKEKLGLGSQKLEAWDVPLLLQKCQQHYNDDRHIAEYLSYSSLMKGVELILSKVLGLGFTQEEPEPGELWHPSVQKYAIRDGSRILGVLYLDPFQRPGKMVQSAQFTLQGSKLLAGGEMQLPKTALVYALPAAVSGVPLSFAVTFMHEIGHAVHSLLSETRFQHMSGTRGTVDFVEFPSHLFEHFVLDTDCLVAYASHHKTGESMPLSVQESCRVGRTRFAHFEAAQQLLYSVIDQAFYLCHADKDNSASQVKRKLEETLSQFELDAPYNGTLSSLLGISKLSKFDHLVHYGGSYYCYIFNRALSAHVWRHGFEGEPFSPAAGQRLRGMFRNGSVVQDLDVICALCPDAGSFRAEDVPLDPFMAQLCKPGLSL